jgi:hypothetical protein
MAMLLELEGTLEGKRLLRMHSATLINGRDGTLSRSWVWLCL